MTTSSQLLLTFLLNAVWQIALIAALASFGAWLLRHGTGIELVLADETVLVGIQHGETLVLLLGKVLG